MDSATAVRALSALAHESRLGLFRQLVEAGPEGERMGAIARTAGLGLTTASAQLGVLSNAGLVSADRDGRHVIYRARFDATADLLRFLMQDCCRGRCEILDSLPLRSRRSSA